MTLQERLKVRISNIDDALLSELIQTAQDRIKFRCGLLNYDERLDSIAVEVVSAMYNRHLQNSHGEKSESVDTFSVTYVDDLLAEYEQELKAFKSAFDKENGTSSISKVVFL